MDELEGLVSGPDGRTWALHLRLVDDFRPQRRRMTYPKTTRVHLLSAQQHRCALCGGPLGLYDSHIDHIVPVAAGGSDDLSNLQLTHMSCNLRKGARQEGDDQGRMPWA